MHFEPTQKGISDVFGAISITCWLFAQFPQVIENYRLASCKGLALPFLVNWLLGDFTNLIGCIFTDQLPFQTYLATYFCFVDAILILQYFHYTRKHKHRLRHAPHHHHHHHSYSSRLGSQHIYQSITHSSRPSISRTRSVPTSTQTSQVLPPLSTIHREVSRSSSRSHVHFPDSPRHFDADLNHDNSNAETPVQMTESSISTNSDGSTSTIAALTRGRSAYRTQATSASAPDIRTSSSADALDHHFRQASSGSRPRLAVHSRDPSINSRTRSVVFLSLWTFVGLGQLFGRSFQSGNNSASIITSTSTATAFAWKAKRSVDALGLSSPGNGFEEPIPLVPIDYSRLVGRLAAWMCVCFYLTSRMPQIWKNFQRRSVEGLSILLFAAAFLGNLFYVLSILTSPLVQEEAGYLFESVPFLLGSGGTLIFDLTIMGQACLYAGMSPQKRERERERSDYRHGEEASGLLSREHFPYASDSLERSHETINQPPVKDSRNGTDAF